MWLGAKLWWSKKHWRIKKHLWVTHYQNLTYLNSKFFFLRSLKIKSPPFLMIADFLPPFLFCSTKFHNQAIVVKLIAKKNHPWILKYTPHFCLILLHSGKNYAKLKRSSESNNLLLYAIKVWQTSSAFLNLLKKYSRFFTLIMGLVLYGP